ncbi:MAG: hypothetical protein K8S13_05770 [Desulfobacula sp.]|uniref:hypothetical protein n=1 Tax=Desulfobacula sp. TaxID=2593537 RepID=UPI0025BE8D91|nr:hypothetical protein [Desulfobacula sp.]MCD4719352.1 hypothetical protein [Desulfobacula sp.]
MKSIKTILFVAFIVCNLTAVSFAAGLIIDHTCTDIWQVPETWINQAKSDLHIAYGHTSHGSQLTSGMGSNGVALDQFMTANGATPDLYTWNNGGTGGALDFHDYFVSGDLGNPDRVTWAQRTRDYLNNSDNSDVNVVIWSWCGQADTSIANIDIYLDLMEDLIAEYPDVNFIFMTGHLNGTGLDSQLNLANEHIRNHCRTHGRILYDFADIESYDPDGFVNYMELRATDSCYYDSDENGLWDKNWALDWQNSYTLGEDWWESEAAHSQHLNGNLKGYAAWWLWARLAGWPDCQADIDQDSDVDGKDLSGFINQFYSSCLDYIASLFGK